MMSKTLLKAALAVTAALLSFETVQAQNLQIDYLTYIGGTERNRVVGSDVDGVGNIYVFGHTSLPDFPGVTPSVIEGGALDLFVARIDPDQGAFDWITVFGSPGDDLASDFAIGDDGNLYLTGISRAEGFPVINGHQPSFGGGASDGVVAAMNPSGELIYSSYIGGSEAEDLQALTFAPNGGLIVTGFTDSPDFPLADPLQDMLGGDDDIFIVFVDPNTGELLFSSYFGGSGRDRAYGTTVDPAGRLWISGQTRSLDFPLMNPADDTIFGTSSSDAFVTRIDHLFPGSSGTPGLGFSTLLGGSGFDQMYSVSSDSFGNIFGVGATSSDDILTVNPSQPTYGGGQDGYFVMLGPDGGILNASYLGLENNREELRDVVATNNGCAVAVGSGITFGTSDTYSMVQRLCNDGSVEDLGSIGLAIPSDVKVSNDGTQIALAGVAQENGISPTPNAVQAEPPTEDDDSNKDNCFAALLGLPDLGDRRSIDVSLATNRPVASLGDTIGVTITVRNTGNVDLSNVALCIYADRGRVAADQSWEKISPPPGMVLYGPRPCDGLVHGYLPAGEVWVVQGVVTPLTIDSRLHVTAWGEFDRAISDTDSIIQFGVPTDLVSALLVAFGADAFVEKRRSIEQRDVYLDSVLIAVGVSEFQGVRFDGTTLTTLRPVLEITETGDPDNSTPVAATTVDLRPSDSLAVFDPNVALAVYWTDVDSLIVAPIPGWRSGAKDGTKVEVVVANVSGSVVDVAISSAVAGKIHDGPLADDLEPGQSSEFTAVDPVRQTVVVRGSAGGSQLVAVEIDLSTGAGEVVTLVVGGSEEAIGIVAAAADGSVIEGAVVTATESEAVLPQQFAVTAVYPNPLSTEATVKMDLPFSATVRLEVYDVVGRRVLTIREPQMAAGSGREIKLNASNLPAGAYLFSATALTNGVASTETGTIVVTR